MKTFPKLYQRTQTGAIQTWLIEVDGPPSGDFGTMTTTHGQLDGKLQTTADTVCEGKNLGKKNATTALEQAFLEAEAKWRKKIEREGYVEDLEQAKRGEDARQGMAPMLAQPWDKVEKKFRFPCDIQRKFNGNRLIAIIEDGIVTPWSRKQKPITGVPHIQAELERAFARTKGRFVLDGEAYRHGWSLQKISGYFRKEDTKPGFEEICYCVYDTATKPNDNWVARKAYLEALFQGCLSDSTALIQPVTTTEVGSIEEAWALQKLFVQEGYEGAILRAHHTPYESDKRSHGLAKLKSWRDEEFKILGVNEGRGKFVGKAVFSLQAANGKTFDCCAPGTMEDRAGFFNNKASLIGKQLTVKYFELSEDGTPLFPVGVAVRDYNG